MWTTPACSAARQMACASSAVPAERLLAEDVLAVPGRFDGRLGVQVVGAAVVEEADARIEHLLAPVRGRLGPAVRAARLLHRSRAPPGDGHELGHERRIERGRTSRNARECALPMKA